MKRIIFTFIVLACFLSALVGCNSVQSEASDVLSQAESLTKTEEESNAEPNDQFDEDKQTADYFAETAVLGNGTTVYCIDTAEQLYSFARLVNEKQHDFAGEVVLVRNDIELNSIDNIAEWEKAKPENTWTPVGSEAFAFKGEFAGGYIEGKRYNYKNVTISGVYCLQDEGAAAFFGKIENAKIAYITLDRSLIGCSTENEYGSSAGLVNRAVRSEITWCENRVDLLGNNVAGIVCTALNSSVTWCNNYGNITAGSCGGGIVESMCSGEVFNCVNMGNLICKTEAGGVICAAIGSGSIAIASCANYGEVTADENAGGIIGVIDAEQTIVTALDLLNVGKVISTGKEYPDENRGNAGGIIGYYNIMSINGLGDIFIKNTLNVGEISGKYYQNATVGNSRSSAAVIQNCYYLSSSCKDGGLGTPLETEELVDATKNKLIDNCDWSVVGESPYPVLNNTRIPLEQQ